MSAACFLTFYGKEVACEAQEVVEYVCAWDAAEEPLVRALIALCERVVVDVGSEGAEWFEFTLGGGTFAWNPEDDWDGCDPVCELAELLVKARAELEGLKRAALERTPAGTRLAYLAGDELVLLGNPPPEDDSEALGAHNCDALGCGSLSHVVMRRRLSAAQLERLQRGERVGLSGEHAAPASQEQCSCAPWSRDRTSTACCVGAHDACDGACISWSVEPGATPLDTSRITTGPERPCRCTCHASRALNGKDENV